MKDLDISRFELKSTDEVADFAGVTEQATSYWIREGMPRTPKGPRKFTYNAAEIFRWYIASGPGSRRGKRKTKQNGQKAIEFGEDEALFAGDEQTPALERWRLSRAKLSELEYEKATGTVVPLDEICQELAGLAGHLRKLGERMAQQFGPDAQRLLNDALDEYQKMVVAKFGSTAGCPQDNGNGNVADARPGDGTDRPTDQSVGGGGNLDTNGGTQGETIPPQPTSSQQDLVSGIGQRPMVADSSSCPDTERQNADGLCFAGPVPSL